MRTWGLGEGMEKEKTFQSMYDMKQLTLELPRAVALLGVGMMPAPCPKPCSHLVFVTLRLVRGGSFTSSPHSITGIPSSSLVHWLW